VEVARRVGGEIVSFDSRQVFAGVAIASNAAAGPDLGGVRQHLVGVIAPNQGIDAARYLALARPLVEGFEAKGVPAILVAGTGLYLRALVDGFDLGGFAPDAALRADLDRRASADLAALAEELRARAPEVASRIDMANPVRVVRHLELVLLRERGARAPDVSRPLPTPLVGLTAPLPLLTRWIEARVDAMWERGIMAEVDALLHSEPAPSRHVLKSVGVAEVAAFLRGELSAEETRAAITRRTRAYARRQLTWFRGTPGVEWIDVAATPASDIVERVVQVVTA